MERLTHGFDVLRRRQDQVRADLDRTPPDRGRGAAAMVGTVYSGGSMPTSLPGQFLVRPTALGGTEAEGAARAATAGAGSVVVTVVGSTVPAAGDLLSAKLVGGRWVAQRTGGSSVPSSPLPGCPCLAVPNALFMHVLRQPGGGTESVVFPAAITHQTRPADLAAYRSDTVGWYSDKFTSSDLFYTFRYWFGCSQGTYFVAGLVTPDSLLGYPGLFLIYSWLVGLPGNTCNPFSLTQGSTNSATYAAQGITIDARGPA